MSDLNKFIEDELTLRSKHYREDPASIVEHYNIEQQNFQTKICASLSPAVYKRPPKG
ncbi:MAG TPA: hypothetical protein VIJ95_05170 [Hanamia sp.]